MTVKRQVALAFDDICLPTSRAAQVRGALTNIDGLELIDGYRGLLRVGSRQAGLRLETDDLICMRCPISPPATPSAALVTNGHLPANVRFARNGHGDQLLAETQVTGTMHLQDTLRNIRSGFRSALRPSPKRVDSHDARPRLTMQHVQEALDELNWDADAIVCHGDSWELRTTVSDESVPVRVELHSNGAELVMQRTILARLPAPASMQAAAYADQALRFNSHLRHVRLADSAGRLVCEARLHAGQLQSAWLATTARAIAFASHHVQLPLRVLAEEESVAYSYMRVIGSSPEPDTVNNAAG